MHFLVEQYRPGSSVDELRLATARLVDAADALAADGIELRFTGATYVRVEEFCFCRFEADSIHAVRTVCDRATFSFDRIVVADELHPPDSARHMTTPSTEAPPFRRPSDRRIGGTTRPHPLAP